MVGVRRVGLSRDENIAIRGEGIDFGLFANVDPRELWPRNCTAVGKGDVIRREIRTSKRSIDAESVEMKV